MTQQCHRSNQGSNAVRDYGNLLVQKPMERYMRGRKVFIMVQLQIVNSRYHQLKGMMRLEDNSNSANDDIYAFCQF